jgi:3-dehydroquinate synthase
LGSNIFITGFSGSGKTTVGREVAERLGWRFVDIDEEVVRGSGVPIEATFRDDGEPGFRELERQCLARVCQGEEQVVSTGGGIVMDERNRRIMERSGVIVCLEARPETIHRRLQAQRDEAPDSGVRPMLDDANPLRRIIALKSERQVSYALAHWTVHTDGRTATQAADEVVRAWRLLGGPASALGSKEQKSLAATVRTSSGDYPVWVKWGGLGELGERVRGIFSPGAAYIVTDEGAFRYARRAQVSMETAGVPSHMFVVPSGERSKSLETARRLYDWLAGRRVERGHLVLAVGGGVVGDLAGYVAATFLRGLHFGQAPTTLLAMMDAAIGGKTAVDLPQGKNLVGAFHQPRFVMEDVQTLETLDGRQARSGWAEAIKHGLILDEGLLRVFEEERSSILALEQGASIDVIRRSVSIKADVVSRDEVETLGLRVLLNYGHTIGHAIEAATGYDRYLHGEAVSVGMMGAAFIANGLGMLSGQGVERQRAVLEAYGLPVSCGDVDMAAVSQAMKVDKKKADGAIRWVLLDAIGHAVTRSDVPPDLVQDALGRLGR